MAYGFIERQNDEEVQTYLEENRYFEAWIATLRNANDVTADTMWEKIEQEMTLKNPKLTDEELESIEIEYYDLTQNADYDDKNNFRIWKKEY